MQKMEMDFDRLSIEDRTKAEFLMQVEPIMQQVSCSAIGFSEAYDRLMRLLGEKELNAVLKIVYEASSNKEETV